MTRRHFVLLSLFCGALVTAVAVVSTRIDFEHEVQQYLARTDAKAMAVIGNVNWQRAAGYGHGFKSTDAAAGRAIAECNRRRVMLRRPFEAGSDLRRHAVIERVDLSSVFQRAESRL